MGCRVMGSREQQEAMEQVRKAREEGHETADKLHTQVGHMTPQPLALTTSLRAPFGHVLSVSGCAVYRLDA